MRRNYLAHQQTQVGDKQHLLKRTQQLRFVGLIVVKGDLSNWTHRVSSPKTECKCIRLCVP